LAAWLSTWRQLWQNQGGFGVLGAGLDDSDNNKTDRDAVGNISPSG
jgi:hypothetical protein